MGDAPGSGRFASRSSAAILAEARRYAADIRRRAERDAAEIRRDAAEWAATTRLEAEEHRDRLLSAIEQRPGPPGTGGDDHRDGDEPSEGVIDLRRIRPPPESDREVAAASPPPPEEEPADVERTDFVASYLAEHRRRRRWRIVGIALLGVLAVGAVAVFTAMNLPDESGPVGGDPQSADTASTPDLVALPSDVEGRPLAEVIAELEDSGLESSFTHIFDEEVPAGAVISMTGAPAASVPRTTVVTLLVSKGPAPRTLPAFGRGADADTVVTALEQLGLRPQQVEEFHEDVPAGRVLEIAPPSGSTVERGATVTITVSRGPDVVEVPDVVGRTLDEARARLDAAGLTVGVVHGHGHGLIVDQAPDAGTTARRGASVNLRRGP